MCSYSWKSVIFSVTSTYHVMYTAIFKWDAAKMWKAVTEIFTRWSEFPVKKVVHLLLFSADQNSYILNKTYDFHSCWTKKKKACKQPTPPPPQQKQQPPKNTPQSPQPKFYMRNPACEFSVVCVGVCSCVCALTWGLMLWEQLGCLQGLGPLEKGCAKLDTLLAALASCPKQNIISKPWIHTSKKIYKVGHTPRSISVLPTPKRYQQHMNTHQQENLQSWAHFSQH